MNTVSHAIASAQPFSGAAPHVSGRQHGCHPLPLSAHSIRSRAHRTGHGVEQHHPRPHPPAHAGTQQPEPLQSHADGQ